MTTEIKTLVQSKELENVQTTQYQATNVTATIDKFTVTNTSLSNVSLSVNLVTSGDVAGDDNLILKEFTVPPGKTYQGPELTGHNLQEGDFISTLSSAVSALTILVSGREIS